MKNYVFMFCWYMPFMLFGLLVRLLEPRAPDCAYNNLQPKKRRHCLILTEDVCSVFRYYNVDMNKYRLRRRILARALVLALTNAEEEAMRRVTSLESGSHTFKGRQLLQCRGLKSAFLRLLGRA